MMIRAHAAMSAKGRLEPFEYDPGQLAPSVGTHPVGQSPVPRRSRCM